MAGRYCPHNATIDPMVGSYPCSPGRYGVDGEFQSLCSGQCPAGYFCPSGTAEDHKQACGSATRFCPVGSDDYNQVSTGYYTIPESASQSLRTGQIKCPRGDFCTEGIRYPCPAGRYGNETSLVNCFPCDPGKFQIEAGTTK